MKGFALGFLTMLLIALGIAGIILWREYQETKDLLKLEQGANHTYEKLLTDSNARMDELRQQLKECKDGNKN